MTFEVKPVMRTQPYKTLVCCLLLAGFAAIACGVTHAQRRDYLKEPEIEEKDGMVTVRVNTPRPLEQALCAIAKRHDWLIDYEDPEYFSGFDFVDTNNPEWGAAHP